MYINDDRKKSLKGEINEAYVRNNSVTEKSKKSKENWDREGPLIVLVGDVIE